MFDIIIVNMSELHYFTIILQKLQSITFEKLRWITVILAYSP
jgi:hypothetical protein